MTKAPVKKKTAVKKAATKKTSNLPKRPKPDWGITELAEHLGITPVSARQKLRKAEIGKVGMVYDFKNKTGMEAVAKTLSQQTRKKKKTQEEEEE